jgi:hypothetical protein
VITRIPSGKKAPARAASREKLEYEANQKRAS